MKHLPYLILLLFILPSVGYADRHQEGLVVLYDFSNPAGSLVEDRSGQLPALRLKIANPENVKRSKGTLQIIRPTTIKATGATTRLRETLQKSNAVSVEAWIQPANLEQDGPARIISFSQNSTNRWFSLLQERNRYEMRFSTDQNSSNGQPELRGQKDSAKAKLTHLLYTKAANGTARLFVNGEQNSETQTPGSIAHWNDSFSFLLGNEATGDRPWLGTIYLAAVYDRALTPDQVRDNFTAGIEAAPAPPALTKTHPAVTAPASPEWQGERVRSGLQVLYDFSEASGTQVKDRSGLTPPADLSIANPDKIRWEENGSLLVFGKSQLRTDEAPRRLIAAVRESGEVTIEAWLRTARTDQEGPARIVTLSQDSTNRNFTLGQEKDRFDVRFRTNRSGPNGMPSLASKPGAVKPQLQHVVYTRDRSGKATLYLDGKPNNTRNVEGDTSNWAGNFRLALADELNYGRHWLGSFHLVAIYSRDLSPKEVATNFRAGPKDGEVIGKSKTPEELLTEANAAHFRKKIAPILARQCLDCHDPSTRKGKLDLSRADTAFASAGMISKGNAANSLLWESIETDEMPHDRPPLSAEEKQAVKQWIDDGATWPIQQIDAADYAFPDSAARVWARRLTINEYIETVKASVGVDIAKEAREILPPDLRADGFRNTAYNLSVDLKHIESYAQLAEKIVEKMDVAAFAARFSNSRSLTDKQMRKFLEAMGKWVLRGPLDEYELVSFRGISTSVASAGGDFDDATAFILEAMLQSPRFLYRIENQRGDGSAWPVTDYEMASRISYLLWGAPPDEQLMQAADRGELTSADAIKQHVVRMMSDPRAIERSVEFVSDWLNLDSLDNLRPAPEKFPDWNPQLAEDMKRETRAYFREIVWEQQRPLADLLNTPVAFVTPALATHYGFQNIPHSENGGLVRVDLSNEPGRGGLLTQGAVLTKGGDEASMVTRGLFVLHDILRGIVSDPPPCVDTTPVASEPGLTQRSIAEDRIAKKSCGVCHAKFEPLAFGLEKFNGLGSFHENDEHGNPLREDGEILIPGNEESIAYQKTAELMDLLAESDRVAETLSWKIAQFALGRPLIASDSELLRKAHQEAAKNGGTYADVITAIALSDLVRSKATERDE